ncbi:MAG: TonB-dependent receptor, partial [Bryobacteraceae bacterium]
YYTDLEGGILEGLGRLFRGQVKLLVHPTKSGATEALIDAATLEVSPQSQPLYAYLRQNGQIEAIREFHEDQLHIYPDAVLAQIRSGTSKWEKLVPPPVAQLIKGRRLFGYVPAQ